MTSIDKSSDVNEFAKMIKQSEKIVVFTGAGLSTASGVSDFKNAKPFFDKANGDLFTGPDILNKDCLSNNPELFFDYFIERLDPDGLEPNFGHHFIQNLEEEFGKKVTVVTQNIDNLHNVLEHQYPVVELHGNAAKWVTIKEGKEVLPESVIYLNRVAVERHTNIPVRPDIVLYGEQLNNRNYTKAEHLLFDADMLIVLGTELDVFPAAGLLARFQGTRSVYINKTWNKESANFKLFFESDISSVLTQVYSALIES